MMFKILISVSLFILPNMSFAEVVDTEATSTPEVSSIPEKAQFCVPEFSDTVELFANKEVTLGKKKYPKGTAVTIVADNGELIVKVQKLSKKKKGKSPVVSIDQYDLKTSGLDCSQYQRSSDVNEKMLPNH